MQVDITLRRDEMEQVSLPAWGVDSEVAPLREVLLCRPKYLSIEDNANSVVKLAVAENRKFDRNVAKQQHQRLVAELEGHGVAARYISELSSQISQTYTRDSSFMTPWGAVITLMEARRRRGEYAAVIDFCNRHSIPIWNMVTDGSLEGGDVHVAKPGKVLLGYSGGRTTKEGAQQVAAWFSEKGWRNKLIYFDRHFLHLDVLFCMVEHDTAIICSDVLSPSTVNEIVEFLEIENPIRSTYRQAMKLLGNALSLGNRRLILHKDADNAELVRQLENLKFRAIQVDLSMFTLDGGGPHCLALGLHRDPFRRVK